MFWNAQPPLGAVPNKSHNLSKGLVGHWLMNEGGGIRAHDVSGFNNHGTLTNGPSWKQGRKSGSSLSFDGANDYVNYGDVTFLDGLSSWAIAAWFRIPDTAGQYALIGKWNDHVNDRGIIIDIFGGNLRFLKGTGVASQTNITAAVNANVWQHVVGLQNGVDVVLYINGIERLDLRIALL